jgi:cell wall assembly regulator SMI1
MTMEVREEVRRLLSEAKGPGSDSWPSIDENSITDFQARVGIPLPLELRDWLSLVNGAPLGPGGFFGIGTSRRSLDMESYLNEYPEWVKKNWLPIAGDGTGNYYVLSVSPDRQGQGSYVLYVDTHEDPTKPAYVVASGLWHFFRFLLRNELGVEGWPFSREKVIEDDPAIMLIEDVPHPWDA